jgi:predicted ester cyclase
MSPKDNKEWVRQYFQALSEVGDDATKFRALFYKSYTPEYIYHSPELGDLNREQAAQAFTASIAALPATKITIDDMVAEGDKVVTRYTLQAAHKGPFMGIPVTGKTVSMKAILITRIVGGKGVEEWEIADMLGMMTQLGAIPAPKK